MHGEITQGARTDLDECRRIASTTGMRGVTRLCSYQGIRTASAFLEYHETVRDWIPNVVWIYGPTGVGKTQLAFRLADSEDRYIKKSPNRWFQGYDGHRTVIFDDIREEWMPFVSILGLLDSKPFVVENKGGSRQFLAEHVYITSILPPTQAFGHQGVEPIGQLMRRITTIINLGDAEVFAIHHPVPEVIIPDIVPDVPEVAGVIINPATGPPALARQDHWGNRYGFAYRPQDDPTISTVAWSDVSTIEE